MHSRLIIKSVLLLALVLVLGILLLNSSIPTKAQGSSVPAAVEDHYTIDEDHKLVVSIPGVLANDAKVDDKPLTAILVDDVSSGSLVFNQDGSFRYTPEKNFNGVTSFTYRVHDEILASDVTTVTLTINPINDAPVITGLPYSLTVEEGSSIRFDLSDKVADVETAPTDMKWSSSPGDKAVANVTVDAAQVATIAAIEGEASADIQFKVVDRGDPDDCEASVTPGGCSEPANANHTLAVTVKNVSPSVEAGRDAAIEVGTQFQLQAIFTDPGVLDTHTARIDFGDGRGSQPATVNQGAGSGTVTGAKVYPGPPATYTIEICVTDDDAGTGCDDLTLTVMDGPPALPGPLPDEPDLPEKPAIPPERPTPPPEKPGSPDWETIWSRPDPKGPYDICHLI